MTTTWDERNPEKVRTYKRAWAKAHPEGRKAWIEANQEKMKVYKSAWYQANRNKAIASARASYIKHIDKIKERNWSRAGIDLSVQEYQGLLEKQNYKCAVCSKTKEQIKRKLVVDHNHSTGKVRGLLCDACNRALGMLGESVKTLEAMIAYIKNTGENK